MNYSELSKKERYKHFEEQGSELLSMHYDVEKRANGSFTFTDDNMGTMDYFPKGDKLLFRLTNGWINGGYNFIMKELIEKNNAEECDAEFQLKRLYDWLITPEEKRERANTKFTAGMLRNVAREIEYLIYK